MVLPLENEIHIFAPRCNILYIIISVKRKGGANIQNNCQYKQSMTQFKTKINNKKKFDYLMI